MEEQAYASIRPRLGALLMRFDDRKERDR